MTALGKPGGHDIGPIAEDEMEVIRHDGETQHVDAELTGQQGEPLFEPELAVAVILAGERIVAAEKSAPHAAVDTMKRRDFRRIEDIRPSQPRHGGERLGDIQP